MLDCIPSGLVSFGITGGRELREPADPVSPGKGVKTEVAVKASQRESEESTCRLLLAV